MESYRFQRKHPRRRVRLLIFLGALCGGVVLLGRWGLEVYKSGTQDEGVYAGEGGGLTLSSLKNGLGVVVREDHRLPVASVQVWYKVGSVDETDQNAGISHLLEHMMFKGTQKVGPEEYPKIVQRMGGQVNAGTSKDFTFYYADVPKQGIEKVLELEADRMKNLIITEQTLAPEREVVKEERRLRVENDVDGLLIENLYKEAFLSSPYRIDTTGTMEALDQITPEKLLEYYRRFYSPSNAIVVIAGDVESKEAFQLVDRYFGALEPSTPLRGSIPDEPDQEKMRVKEVVRGDVQYRATVGGFKVPFFKHEDSLALMALEKVLGNSSLKSSRLYKDLVVNKPVATEVQAIDSRGRYPGLFIVYLQLRDGVDAVKAREELFATLGDLSLKGPSPEELEMAKSQLALERGKALERVYGLGFEVGLSYVNADNPSYLPSLYEKLSQLGSKDIQRVVDAYFKQEHATFVDLVSKAEGS